MLRNIYALVAIAVGLLLLAAAGCDGDEPTAAPDSVPRPTATVAGLPSPEPPGKPVETATPSPEASIPTHPAPALPTLSAGVPSPCSFPPQLPTFPPPSQRRCTSGGRLPNR